MNEWMNEWTIKYMTWKTNTTTQKAVDTWWLLLFGCIVLQSCTFHSSHFYRLQGWPIGAVVTRRFRSTKLLYVDSGEYCLSSGMHNSFQTGKLSRCVISHTDQLSLAILLWVGDNKHWRCLRPLVLYITASSWYQYRPCDQDWWYKTQLVKRTGS